MSQAQTPPPAATAPQVQINTPPAPGVETKSPFLDRLRGKAAAPPAQSEQPKSKLLASLEARNKKPSGRLVEPTEEKKVEAPPTPTPAAAPEPPKEEKPPTPEAKPEPKKKSAAPKQAESAAVEKVAKTVDRLASTVEKLATQRAEPKTATASDPKLSAKQERTLAIMQELETIMPDKYEKGFAKHVRSMMVKAEDYERQYAEKHPNATDEEIEDAVAKFEHANGLNVDPDHVETAKESLLTRPFREKLDKQERILQQLMEGEQRRSTAPALQKTAAIAAVEVAKGFGEKFTELIDKSGRVDESKVQEFIDRHDDPVTAEFAVSAMRDAREFAQGISSVRLNQPHKVREAAMQFIKSVEDRYIETIGNQDDRGRDLVREVDIDNLPQKEIDLLIEDKHPSKFIIPESDIISLASDDILEMAKQDIERDKERLKRFAPKLGLKPEAPVRQPTPKPASPTAADPAPASTPAPTPETGFSTWKNRLKNGEPKTRLSLLNR